MEHSVCSLEKEILVGQAEFWGFFFSTDFYCHHLHHALLVKFTVCIGHGYKHEWLGYVNDGGHSTEHIYCIIIKIPLLFEYSGSNTSTIVYVVQ